MSISPIDGIGGSGIGTAGIGGRGTNETPDFCEVLTFAEFSVNGATTDISSGVMTATNAIGGVDISAVFDSTPTFVGDAGTIIKFEATLPAPSAFNESSVYVFLIDDLSSPTFTSGVRIDQNTNVGDVAIKQLDGTTILSGLTLSYPYTFHLEVNISTGVCSFTDGTNSDSFAGIGAGGAGLTLKFCTQLDPPTAIGQSNSISVNAGSTEMTFDNINASAKLWCQ